MSDGEIYWVRFFPGDWLSGTSGLTAAERGVYVTLLALIYDNGGAIIRDDARLARKCGAAIPTLRRIIDDLIADGKIEAIDGRLSNRRASREIDRAQKISGTRAKTASARWEKVKENQRPKNANAMQMERESESESELDKFEGKPSNESIEGPSKKSKGLKPKDAEIDAAFATFWTAYPERVAKVKARAAFKSVYLELPAILAGLEIYKATKPSDRNWMHPTTFLNGRRWEDAPASVSTTATASAPRRNTRTDSDILEMCGVDVGQLRKESGL